MIFYAIYGCKSSMHLQKRVNLDIGWYPTFMEVVSIIHGLHNNAQHEIRKEYKKNSDHISEQNAIKKVFHC